MKKGIHPAAYATKVACSCGATYTIQGTVPELHTEVCMKCHPHYTGERKLLDTEGRATKFMAKFKNAKKK
ncbi:50S ribosomal protein L31 [Candidatus Peregrinibacteria bacterium]|nr:50S ribosomal protein L31 [Candidatus Peregrinibacteria bacterium]